MSKFLKRFGHSENRLSTTAQNHFFTKSTTKTENKRRKGVKLTILLNFSIVINGIVPRGIIFLVPSLFKKKIKKERESY